MTPLVQSMSVFTTLALLMVTPPSLTATLAVLPSTVLTSCPSSLTTSAARTLPGITWYLRMAISLSLFSGLRRLSTVPSGSLAKASSVGARTVNGPWPLSVSTRSAALTAATRVLNEPAPTAVSTMSFFSPTKAGTTRASAATIPRSVRMIELPHVMSCEGSKFVTGNFIYTRNESDRHLPGVSQARAAGCLAYSTINSDLRCGRWAPTYRFRAFPVATWGVEGVAWPAVSWRRVGGRGRRSAVPWPPPWQSSWQASSLRRRPWSRRPSRPIGSPGRSAVLLACVLERKHKSCGARNADNRGQVRHRCRGPVPRGVPGTRRLDSWEPRARGWSAGRGDQNPRSPAVPRRGEWRNRWGSRGLQGLAGSPSR